MDRPIGEYAVEQLTNLLLEEFNVDVQNEDPFDQGLHPGDHSPEKTDAELLSDAATKRDLGATKWERREIELSLLYSHLSKEHKSFSDWVNKGAKGRFTIHVEVHNMSLGHGFLSGKNLRDSRKSNSKTKVLNRENAPKSDEFAKVTNIENTTMILVKSPDGKLRLLTSYPNYVSSDKSKITPIGTLLDDN